MESVEIIREVVAQVQEKMRQKYGRFPIPKREPPEEPRPQRRGGGQYRWHKRRTK